jgi:hypothetical protein
MEIYHGELVKLPRKMKKAFWGKRIGKTKIRRMFKRLAFTKLPRNIYEYHEYTGVDDLFCPRCGCTEATSTGNMAEYPEMYIVNNCERCGLEVGSIDNSPFVHILQEMKEVEAIGESPWALDWR